MRGYLEPGEQLQLEDRPHGVALVGPFVRALGLGAAGGLVLGFARDSGWGFAAVGAFALVVAAIFALGVVWRWDRTIVVLTSEKLFVVHGVIRRRAAAVRLSRVGAVEVEQGPLGRVLGYGTVIAGNLEIPYVRDPRRFGA